MSAPRLVLCAALVAGCKPHPRGRDEAPAAPAMPAAAPATPAASAASAAWPELAGLPRAAPVREIALPTRTSAPRFDVAGPVIAGGIAVVASSQFGFLGVDYRRGQIAWTRPAGEHVAPPVVVAQGIALLGDCENPPDGRDVLGCARVVAPDGTDRGYVAIRGIGAGAFAAARGPERAWPGGHGVIWRRGDRAIDIDLASGAALPSDAAEPPIVLADHQLARDDDGAIVARGAWRTDPAFARLLGVVARPGAAPVARAIDIAAVRGAPAFGLVDLDAAGMPHPAPGPRVPGIAVLDAALASSGAAALAIRIDTSMQRDVVAAYTADGHLAWTAPLPIRPRPDPVGVAIAPDAVLAFFDGDTLAVWAPPPASQNPTP